VQRNNSDKHLPKTCLVTHFHWRREVFADIASIWHRLSNIDLEGWLVFADYATVIFLIHPALHYRGPH
jgi:hypothetical protein